MVEHNMEHVGKMLKTFGKVLENVGGAVEKSIKCMTILERYRKL